MACGRILIFLLIVASSCVSATRIMKLALLEELAIGTEVRDLKEDLTSAERQSVSYKLTNQYLTVGNKPRGKKKWITLNQRSGVITVNHPVDRETDCGTDSSLPCVLRATILRRPERYFQVIELYLRVKDINDHPPRFPVSSVIEININEQSQVNARVSLDRFLATDADTGLNAKISYLLENGKGIFGLEQKNDITDTPYLELVVTDKLDHETHPTFDLTLVAIDRGDPPQRSDVALRVYVTDANDNAPIFEEQIYTFTLKENLPAGHVIGHVVAHDADSDAMGAITYWIPKRVNSATARKLIRVDPASGEIVLNQTLDRQLHNNIHIVIGARDCRDCDVMTQRNSGTTRVIIEVEDVNDNSPVIHINIIEGSSDGTAYVSEASHVGTYVAHVNAEDEDFGSNGRVAVQIMSFAVPRDSANGEAANDYFVLMEGGVIATGRKLDRESIPVFRIEISACDTGLPARCSSRNLTVELLDANDNSPEFAVDDHVINMREDTVVGTVVASVTATDRDSLFQPALTATREGDVTMSRNGAVRYELEDVDGCFRIDANTGLITLQRPLNYELTKEWHVMIKARDQGDPPRMSEYRLTVQVDDVNDNAPRFSHPAISNSTVFATIRSDAVITTIHAVDGDEGTRANVWYSIVDEDGSNISQKFILDSLSGDLRLNSSNPHMVDMVGIHHLTIRAQDLGAPPMASFIKLSVDVTDLSVSQLERKISDMRVARMTSGVNMTVIFIASLVGATILLGLILTGVVVKCQKKNKEVRTYNCRNAESTNGRSKLSLHHPDDVIVLPSNHLMTSSCDVSGSRPVSRCQSLRPLIMRSDSQRSFAQQSQITSFDMTSHRVDSLSRRSMERKMSSFRKPELNPVPTPQIDRDSGRGDSDHEMTSAEEKNRERLNHPVTQLQNHPNHGTVDDELHHQHPAVIGANDMGPLCTHLCRQYGHSDTCWMHVLDSNSQHRQAHYHTNYPTMHHYDPRHQPFEMTSTYVDHNYPCSESQPLHSVLMSVPEENEAEALDDIAGDYYHQRGYASYPADSYYHQQAYVPHTVQCDPYVQHQPHIESRYHPPTVECTFVSPSSASYPSTSSAVSPPMTSRGSRWYVASHDDELRFQATSPSSNAPCSSLTDARSSTPASNSNTNNNNYEEISMSETQQIISDIDQLIDT